MTPATPANARALAQAAVANIRATTAQALAQEKQSQAPAAALLEPATKKEAKTSGYERPTTLTEAERAVFNSPYAFSYFGPKGVEEEEDEDNYLDYGQYTMPEDDEQQSEDEIIRPARARTERVKEYVVDNSQLQADAPGVAYRFSCQLDDRDERRPVAAWGSIVSGEDASEGWVRVGDRFLPMEVNECRVLVRRNPSKFRGEKRLEDLDESEEDEPNEASSAPWKGAQRSSARRETPAERRARLFLAEQLRASDQEHEDYERRSRELLKKHQQLLQEPMATHYSVLGIRRSATVEEIQQAFKALCKLYHPDKVEPGHAGTERAARERAMAQLNEAHAVLSSEKRWAYDRQLLSAEKVEPEEATVLQARRVTQTESDLADADFDFTGDGRPFRSCKGRAARVAKSCGSREKVRMVMQQLVGQSPMELADCKGVIRHVGPMTPLGGLGECGHPKCSAHRLKYPEIRAGFRDFIVSKVRDALRTQTVWWGPEGLRYVSLGSGELLFDLELLERLREEAGVTIAQICLIDRAYETPSHGTRRALREFADWQRASAQLRRVAPAEVLAFGRLQDFFQAAAEGGRASGCHVFVQCDAYWHGCAGDCNRLASRALCPNGLLARLAESTDTLDAELPKGALVAPFQGDLVEPPQEMGSLGDGALLSSLSVAHLGGLHVGEPFFSAAWTLAMWPPECFKPPSLQPVEHPLLSRREEASRIRIIGKERALAVWRVTDTRIAVRAGPHAQAQIVDVFYKGDEVLATGAEGPWLRIAQESWPNPADAPEEAWVLQDGRAFGLGLLLQQVTAPR
ncbi:Chaperone protein DnaJ [Durusdinium trenchii]|uniref:Chaperone protein DnaJ n=1 Tax=Durusdinium trenchii TaxID=1381693 RepID=A0ABP0RZS3_9DINO